MMERAAAGCDSVGLDDELCGWPGMTPEQQAAAQAEVKARMQAGFEAWWEAKGMDYAMRFTRSGSLKDVARAAWEAGWDY